MLCEVILSNSLFLIDSYRNILLGSPQRSDHNWNVEDFLKFLNFHFQEVLNFDKKISAMYNIFDEWTCISLYYQHLFQNYDHIEGWRRRILSFVTNIFPLLLSLTTPSFKA